MKIMRTKDGKPITEEEFNARNERFIGNLVSGMSMSLMMLSLMPEEHTYTNKDVADLLTALLNDASDAVIAEFGVLDVPGDEAE